MPAKKTTAKKTAKDKPKTAAGRAKGSKSKKRPEPFPIVGLGASAGGLDALRAFFTEVPADSGMAYVVVVHLSPKQPSMMAELLQKVTSIPVSAITDGHLIEPDHIYVVPPDNDVAVGQGRLLLLDGRADQHSRLPIDRFLRSLAQDQGPEAVAVILSGTGTDGTLGVKEIKARDGLVIAQSEDSAGYDGMPRSAINSGAVDIILPPGEMPRALAGYFAHRELALDRLPAAPGGERYWLNKVFAILRSRVGHDFSQYKANTLLRRISRRMGLNQIETHDQYVRYLQENSGEAKALFRELLIGVTSFFRDPESFEALKRDVLPELLRGMAEGATFRAWVPGCSTGEEVYSLAMVLRESLGNGDAPVNLQLFGTDIDDLAIDKARDGVYPASIAADVGEARLARFFHKEGGFYRVRKEIRDTVVFSVQNVIKDPPFSKLHMLCCRNLLIYLDGEAQRKLLPLFHYTLVPGGIMMLGTSETIGGNSHLFVTLDNKSKIFRRLEVPPSLLQRIDFPTSPPGMQARAGADPAEAPAYERTDFAQLARRAILERFCPTAVVVDGEGNIRHVQGRTGKYLETPSGPPTHQILDMTRTGLRIELSSALREARSSGQPVTRRQVGVRTNGDVQWIDLHVHPQHTPRPLDGCYLIVFQDVTPAPAPGAQEDGQERLQQENAHIADLEKELQSARESHQTTVEELESSNEELKSTNEELQSSNEELQSTNEELESSREELQSLNEELQTVNAELQNKVDELSAAHDDIRNLLNSTEIATIFVDDKLRVRRFTPEATEIVNLIQADMGRPLEHVATNLAYDGIITDLGAVLEHLTPRETEVQTTKGRWYKMRIVPYRTTDNRIDGAVLTFAAIEEQKEAQRVLNAAKQEMQQAWALIRGVFDMNSEPLAVLDAEGRMVIANAAFTEMMALAPDKVAGMDIFEIETSLLGQTDLGARLKGALKKGQDFVVRAERVARSAEPGKYLISGRIIRLNDDRVYRILLHIAKEP